MMLTTDAVVSASSFDRRQHQQQQHHFELFNRNHLKQTMAYFQVNPSTDDTSDCDAQSDKSNSNTNIKKSIQIENNGRSSSRRKQAAPRSRLVRQCDQCDFTSSIINEFKTHLKFEHGQEQIFFCEQCRFYTSSSFDYNLHLHTHQTNLQSTKVNESDEDDNISSKEQNSFLFENDEPISDDEQNPSTSTNKKLNLSVTSSHSNSIQQTLLIPDRKRPYNVSVDPKRYRRVPDPDDASAVKFACSLCGNLYKWRKSLNKHWKEKHNDEEAPPLDAPVTIRPPKSSSSTLTIQSKPTQRTSEILPQTSMNPPPTSTHHPAFPFNTYAWLNFASQQMFSAPPPTNTNNDQSSNAPLDLTIKTSNKISSSPSATLVNPIRKIHRDSNSSNDEQRDSANYNGNDSEDDGHSEHASSSSPPNPYGQKIFICSICEQRFLTVESINEHFLKNHLVELENEISGKSPPRNTNVAQQNEEWNLSDPVNPLKCIKCDFVGRWPTELQKHAASHSTSRPFKCLVCSLTYKWRWDLAKHWDRTHACGVKGANLINPYKKRDREQARSMMEIAPTSTTKSNDHHSTCSSIASTTSTIKKHSDDDDEQSETTSIHSDNDDQPQIKRLKRDDEKNLSFPSFIPPPATTAANMFFPSTSLFPHHSMFSSFLDPSLLLPPKFNYSTRPNLDLFKQATALLQQTQSPNSSRSSSPRTSSPQQRMHAVAAAMVAAAANGNSNHHHHHQSQQRITPNIVSQPKKFEKEERNFQCRWCDYRGRWRSELIQHMRCHHARDKPYHCSACPYASSWKWDVQKHVKKQHVHDSAKIVELPDKYLFQTTLKAKYEGTDDRSLAPPPLTEEDYSFFGADVQEKLSSMKYTRERTLACQQCPFSANSMAELRRHIIVHSSESPYHCFNCDFKSKWKCDVKKHMRLCNHHGPVLVGRKAMAKVMESLGLVIGNNEINKTLSLEKSNASIPISTYLTQQSKSNEIEEDEQEIDEDENQNLIIVDENHEDEVQEDDEDNVEQINLPKTNHSRLQNSNLRCRQCDYEADDLSDLLIHRKAHASMKYNHEEKSSNNSDIENDDDEKEKNQDILFDQQTFDYELHWLENNPLIKQLVTIQPKTRSIIYNCSQCNYTVTNNRQYFLNHLDHQHNE